MEKGQTAGALVKHEGIGELTVLDESRADHYERASRSKRTWAQYQSAFRLFSDWCSERGASPMPAAASTLRTYAAWLADQGRADATVNAYMAAIASAHSIAGHPIDRTAIRDVLKGIREDENRKHEQRQARALIPDDLKTILRDFTKATRDVRDRLLFTLGFAGALRRAELSGLDWQCRGMGTGYVTRDECGRGIVLTLLHTKGEKGRPVTVKIPAADMPGVCEALDAWVSRAKVQPSQPLFREILKSGEITGSRLGGRSVSRIIKARVRSRALQAGMSVADADALAALCSGHSLRAGYCTAAAMAAVPEWKIRNRSRHKTAELVARYVRAEEDWKDSGLKGVGF
jgi:integrase